MQKKKPVKSRATKVVAPEVKYLTDTETRNIGLLQEINRQFLHPLGFALAVVEGTTDLKIQDWHDDPEGVLYTNSEVSCYKTFTKFQLTQHARRFKEVGFIIQPLESL